MNSKEMGLQNLNNITHDRQLICDTAEKNQINGRSSLVSFEDENRKL